MRLSENIKKFRLEKALTQEQLAARLGISAQAVSKWETSETYPDGALLVPLAGELGVSIDELFGNDAVSMSDISRRILVLLHQTEPAGKFRLARDICWQIERGLFDALGEIDRKYDPDELNAQHNASYILSDNGFSMVSNGVEPFFALFPQPTDGFGHFLRDKETLQKIFAVLSHPDTMQALIWLYHKPEEYLFERAVLANECGFDEERIENVLDELSFLNLLWKKELAINGNPRVLYTTRPSHILVALFLIAREIQYRGAYTLQRHYRSKPFLETQNPAAEPLP